MVYCCSESQNICISHKSSSLFIHFNEVLSNLFRLENIDRIFICVNMRRNSYEKAFISQYLGLQGNRNRNNGYVLTIYLLKTNQKTPTVVKSNI